MIHHSLGDLWSVLSQVQRLALLERAKVKVSSNKELMAHAKADWSNLPPMVIGALGSVR